MPQYFVLICTSTLIILANSSFIEKPGPRYPPTKGEVWPKPQQETKLNTFLSPSADLHTKVTSHSCTTLVNAIHRYIDEISQLRSIARRANVYRSKSSPSSADGSTCGAECDFTQNENYSGELTELEIELNSPCEDYPYMGMDERYELTIAPISQLKSNSLWGVLRGLETFTQLFYFTDNMNELRINQTHITDFPRYPHRGLLLDTSRHFFSLSTILRILDAMAMNKMNVFHWHIVDDQSFPYESDKFPELSELGAFHPLLIYTKKDIETVITYARDRGIRVIPEFDVPGHTRSWGVAYPNLLTKCYSGNEVIGLGPMDPINSVTYKLIRDLFQEVQTRFPDKYFHVGGDEVDSSCWISNPTIIKYMEDHNMTSPNQLHALFMTEILPLLGNRSTPIVWQEVFDNHVPLPDLTLVQVWKGQEASEINRILNAGKRVLFSSAWYLDHIGSDGSWQVYYKADPRKMVSNKTLAQNVMGGEACMWGEMADDTNAISRIWPRTSAVAERLWSKEMSEPSCFYNCGVYHEIPLEVYYRLEEHTCRMRRRGVSAQPPSGPGFCITS